MKGVRLLLVPALAAASLACSCMGKVVIANPTDHPVTLIVTPERGDSMVPGCDCPHGYRVKGFATTATVDPKGFQHASWTRVDSTAFYWDSGGRAPRLSVAVILPPGSSLDVGSAAFDCSGGIIGAEIPAQVVVVDGDRQTRFDPIRFREHLRKGTRFLMMFEIPSSLPGTPS